MADLKLYSNEKWVSLPFRKTPLGFRYVLTNYGRVISYTDLTQEGRFLKHSLLRGYPSLSFRTEGNMKSPLTVYTQWDDHIGQAIPYVLIKTIINI